MKAAALATLFGMLSLIAWACVRLRAEQTPARSLGNIQPLDDFARHTTPSIDIDLAAEYGTRTELLNPKSSLPSWHEYPRGEAVLVREAMRACSKPPPPTRAVADRALAKALAWHEASCRSPAEARNQKQYVGTPPHMAPSGQSYAELALALDPPAPAEWIREHKRYFHVRELARLAPSVLDAADRALVALPGGAWQRILASDRAVLTDQWLGLIEHDNAGPKRMRLYARDGWNAFASKHALVLEPRLEGGCANPATPVLCFRPLPPAEAHAGALGAWLIASMLLLSAGVGASSLFFVQSRRNAARDRVLVLRTLTHEIRTPATSLCLDIEPLQAAFDKLPEDCQEPLLRLSESVARLDRAIHLSARYLALFDPAHTGTGKGIELDWRAVDSAAEYFQGLREQWPEEVELIQEGDDSRFTTDPDWLAVAVDNLVHNAHRHGRPPVRVTWRLEPTALHVRVSDAGRTPDLRLDRATRFFTKPSSSGGLGLGLAIVARIASLLGGSLKHQAEPTCFELEITNRSPT